MFLLWCRWVVRIVVEMFEEQASDGPTVCVCVIVMDFEDGR